MFLREPSGRPLTGPEFDPSLVSGACGAQNRPVVGFLFSGLTWPVLGEWGCECLFSSFSSFPDPMPGAHIELWDPLSFCKAQISHALAYTVTFPSSFFLLLLFLKG